MVSFSFLFMSASSFRDYEAGDQQGGHLGPLLHAWSPPWCWHLMSRALTWPPASWRRSRRAAASTERARATAWSLRSEVTWGPYEVVHSGQGLKPLLVHLLLRDLGQAKKFSGWSFIMVMFPQPNVFQSTQSSESIAPTELSNNEIRKSCIMSLAVLVFVEVIWKILRMRFMFCWSHFIMVVFPQPPVCGGGLLYLASHRNLVTSRLDTDTGHGRLTQQAPGAFSVPSWRLLAHHARYNARTRT